MTLEGGRFFQNLDPADLDLERLTRDQDKKTGPGSWVTYGGRIGGFTKAVHDEVRFDSYQGSRAKLHRHIPGGHKFTVYSKDILLGEFGSGESENGWVKIGEQGGIVQPSNFQVRTWKIISYSTREGQ